MGGAEQETILSDMQKRGLKMLRIFVSTVPQNFKSTTSQFVPFVESDHMGEYNYTALELINKFMTRAKAHSIKLQIALHDRYELGCWYCDGYQKDLGLNCLAGQPCGPLNPEMGNQRWGDLKEVVAIFQIQNEAQGLDPQPWATHWHCDRAKVMRPLMDPEIFIGTGGGRTFAESMLLEHFQCPEIDVVNLHDYEEVTWGGIRDNLQKARDLGQTWGKNLG
eukprot:Skav207774  [mRNA]  locus=scaffold2087:211277:213029:- [translate_table: standard]